MIINSAPICFVTAKSNYEQELTRDALFEAYKVPDLTILAVLVSGQHRASYWLYRPRHRSA